MTESLTRFLKWLADEPKTVRVTWWIVLFVASFLSFFGVFFIIFHLTVIELSLQQVLVCTAFIMVFTAAHELGHLIGAKIAGVPSHGLYFLPFVGAVADIDKKEKPSVERWKDLFFSIDGPLLGLIILLPVLFLKIIDAYAVLTAVIVWIIVSIYNMLPIYPLDGGRITLDIIASFVKKQTCRKLSRFIGVLIHIILTGLTIWNLSWHLKLSWVWTLATVVLIWLSYLVFDCGKIATEDRVGKPMRKTLALASIFLYLAIISGYVVILFSLSRF